ncbi:MAG: DUF4466 family protein [Bacteroidota bacterium]|jgi:hypothetical protein|nr:DUF4466 family protein [Bacteroidota bacterium]
MKNIIINIAKYTLIVLMIVSCGEWEYSVPEVSPGLKNDCINHSLGPNVVGQYIEFAYAMAIKPEEGKLATATVEASIAGAEGTYLDHKSYYTNGSGVNVGVEVGNSSTTSGNKTTVTFTADTCAATLRYYYKIPEEARGKDVSFTFSASASNGEKVQYEMGPYKVREMDLKLDLIAKDGSTCYISVADMAVYDATAAASNPERIDLIYLHRSVPGVTFNHSIVSPTSDAQYRPGLELSSGLHNKSKLIKAWNIQDRQLARMQYGVFVDDVDLKNMNFNDAPDYIINMRPESGLWVETENGKYRAYIFINKVDNAKKEITFSIKRLQVN